MNNSNKKVKESGNLTSKKGKNSSGGNEAENSIGSGNSNNSSENNINLLLYLKSVMTELDSSSPVIWPSWCYGCKLSI